MKEFDWQWLTNYKMMIYFMFFFVNIKTELCLILFTAKLDQEIFSYEWEKWGNVPLRFTKNLQEFFYITNKYAEGCEKNNEVTT